jgi:hypothetical protein
VAGFDATFRFHPGDHDLIAALMFAARRRARTLRVRWHSALDAEGNGYCSMDGNTFRLDMLLERLRRDLPTIAEASPSGRHTPLQRRRLANGLCDILCRSRVGYTTAITEKINRSMSRAYGAFGHPRSGRCTSCGLGRTILIFPRGWE